MNANQHSAIINQQCSKLARMDSNHDKQNQNLLCYRYTTGQTDREERGVGDGVAGHGKNKDRFDPC